MVRFFVDDATSERELILSRLWDLGTTGLYEIDDGSVVAGFENEGAARHAADRLRIMGTSADRPIEVEPAPPATGWVTGGGPGPVPVSAGGHDFTLIIDAGATFGHGRHPTTRLALQLMMETIAPSSAVLDVGTGSGVLAIAAAIGGAASVTAIDSDPGAMAVARHNAAANGAVIDCGRRTVGEALAARSRGFDLIVLNVLLPVHRELAPAVLAALSPGGSIVTAGYLVGQSPELEAVYRRASTPDRPEGLVAVKRIEDRDWVGHRFRRIRGR